MKALIVSALILTGMSAQAAKTFLINADVVTAIQPDGSEKKSIYFTQGFLENGFFNSSAVCYVGDAKGVCPMVKAAEKKQNTEYSSGDHGTFTLKSCNVSKTTVHLSYERITDYPMSEEESKVSMKIEVCGDNK